MRTSAALLVLAAVGALQIAGCSKSDAQAKGPSAPPPVPVVVGTAVKSDAPILLRTIGTVESRARVVLKPQIAARVAELTAPEGTDVEAGQVLVRLDARPFDVSLRGSEANLARSKALAADAKNLAEQNRAALANGAISPREAEESQAKSDAAAAQVLADEAQLDTTRLNLQYCTISAPFGGRLGQFLVKPGSIVKENETELVELTQTDPIETAFSIPEGSLGPVRDAAAKGPLRVEVLPNGDSGEAVAGTLTFIDNRVDTNSGTIRLKATFDNKARRLWPGQFANVTLVLGHETDCVLVPESAVQPSQNGPALFVVKSDKTVELRQVAVRRTVDGQSVIESGVEAGETVVTDGQLRLAPGSSVQVKSEAKAKG